MNKKKILKWGFLFFWMIIIFIFSNQPHSGEATRSIIEQIIPTIKTNALIDIINFIIRKSAHITEYFILTILTISLLKEYTKKERVIITLSILFCFLYASTDEFHQSLVPGRTSTFKDVLIDTSGGLIAMLAYTLYKLKFQTKNTIE